MKYTIGENTFELKYSIRAMMMYENITGKTFTPDNITNVLTFFYCVVVSSSKDYSYTFDLFLDDVDQDPGLIEDLSLWMILNNTTNEVFKKN